MTFRAALLLTALLVPLGAPAVAQSERPSAPKSKAASSSSPMVFYLAKGEEDACGPGCSEWIAAEGQIDAAAAQRLRTFLSRLGKRKLPIFFHSPGGNGTTSTAMGRLLREREMTAGVYQTFPLGCTAMSEQSCRALKQSGQVLPATLRNVAGCSSACVFALIGAKVREVPPGARLGVHAAKVVVLRSDGRRANHADREVVSFQRSKLAELNAQFRRYVQEMKIDVRLFDLLSKVPHEEIHYLSRDEIVKFGIDTREFHEAPWIATELLQKQLWAMKYFVEAKDQNRKELRTSVLRLECGGVDRAKLGYFRSMGSQETSPTRTIRLVSGDHRTMLSTAGSAFKMDAIENGTSYNLWFAYASFDFLEAAAAIGHIDIVESETVMVPPRVTTLSTAGLSQAISALRGRCSGASVDCWTSNASGGGTRSAICDVPFRP